MPFIRQGVCNRCGQCCGADGSPNQANPWPVNWPGAILRWNYPAFEDLWPHSQLVGLVMATDGTVEVVEQSGNHNIRGKKIYWIWIPGHAICKDLPPYSDPSTYSLECPWLLPDPGDGSRPCSLVGSKFEWIYDKMCFPEGPLDFATQAMVDQWQADHPACSHDWIEF